MNGKDLLIGLGEIGTQYYEEAEASASAPGSKRKIITKPFVIAALIALMLLMMGCAIVTFLKLESLAIGEVDRTRYSFDEERNIVGQTEVTLDVFSVQGIEGTPNFLAAQEWLEFSENYEAPQGEEFQVPPEYRADGVYSQEMADKVDELCEKYSLKPMGVQAHMQSYQFDVLYKALGFDSLFCGGAEFESGAGWFTECGSFRIMFSFTLTSEEAAWKEPIGATMRYVDKEYFDNTVISVDDTAQQRYYPLEDGTSVLIAGTGNDAKILYDREDAFFSIYFDPYTLSGEEVELSDRDLELIAEAIDFTIKPCKPDMAEVEQLLVDAEEAHLQNLNAGAPKTVDELLSTLDRGRYYTIVDLNGDGEDEVLAGSDSESFNQIYVKIGGGYILYTMLLEEYEDAYRGCCRGAMYLCKDNVFEYYYAFEDGAFSHSYCRLDRNVEKGGTWDVDFTRYDGLTGKWHSLQLDTIYDKATDSYIPYNRNDVISEAEARSVIEAHPRVDLDMKPVSEYSDE